MNSAISKEQLNILLNSMQNSISLDKVISEIEKYKKINHEDKNIMYHQIMDVIKYHSSTNDIAMKIVEYIEIFINSKLESLAYGLDKNEIPDATNNTSNGSKNLSPIFRRV